MKKELLFRLTVGMFAALILGAVLAIPGISEAKTRAFTPGEVTIAAKLAPGDSVTFIATWTAPSQASNQYPVEMYAVEWLNDTTVYVARAVTGLSDSLRVAIPALGDSLGPLFVRARTVDTAGQVSTWSVSSEFWLTNQPMPPSPPGVPQIDTARFATEMIAMPQVATTTGATEMCAYSRDLSGQWRVTPMLDECIQRLSDYLAGAE